MVRTLITVSPLAPKISFAAAAATSGWPAILSIGRTYRNPMFTRRYITATEITPPKIERGMSRAGLRSSPEEESRGHQNCERYGLGNCRKILGQASRPHSAPLYE